MQNDQLPNKDDDRSIAIYVAMVIRNAMEEFHSKHLSDNQMQELNPIIRNAVFTALHAMRHVPTSDPAKAFVQFQMLSIPRYWEAPILLSDYVKAGGLLGLKRKKGRNH